MFEVLAGWLKRAQRRSPDASFRLGMFNFWEVGDRLFPLQEHRPRTRVLLGGGWTEPRGGEGGEPRTSTR